MKKFYIAFLALITLPISALAALPSVNIKVTPSTGDLRTNFVLDASNSLNNQGNNQHLQYQFKVSPNSYRTPFSSQSRQTFKASKTGTFKAQVWVRDTKTGSTRTSFFTYRVREELQRDIRISASNTTPGEGETVIYKVTVFGNGFNRDAVQTRWDFNSDGRFDTDFTLGLTGSYTPQVGTTSPTVEVKFPDGQIIRGQGIYATRTSPSRNRPTGRDRIKVVTASNPLKPAIIQFSPNRQNASQNTVFNFDGSDTKMTSGSWLEWIIEGRTITNKDKIRYQFKSSGNKIVTLRHCINRAEPICLDTKTSVSIKAEPNDQFLDITWVNLTDRGRSTLTRDYARATVSDNLRFTVRTQGQPNPGQRFTYRWDFDGDGFWDTDFTEHTSVEHRYNKSSKFVAIVEAQPAITTKNFVSIKHAIPVYIERNRAPQGEFKFTKTGNFVGERIYYTAQVSDEQSGQQVEVRFDSDADGVWDSDFRRQLSWYWVYDVPGKYEVRMQLRDPQGRTNEVKQTMTVLAMPEPEAKVKASHRNQTEGGSILLDATGSEGRELTYEWKVLGQPKVKLQGSRTSLRLPAGDYTVCLIIRDRLGVENQLEFPVSFVPKAQAVATARPSNGVEASPNVLQWLPGAPSLHQDNYVLPNGGVPRGPSPFVIEAGTAIPSDGFVSGMRAR